MGRGKLVVWFAMVLLTSRWACMASCLTVAGDIHTAVSHCHQHQNSKDIPLPCMHQACVEQPAIVKSAVIAPSDSHSSTGSVVLALADDGGLLDRASSGATVPENSGSPPRAGNHSPVVLRI